MCAVRAIPVAPGRGQASDLPGILVNRVLPHPEVPTDHLRITLVRTEPGAVIPTHHHGDQDTVAYVLQGTMGLHCGAGLREDVWTRPGEIAFIEPFVVHAEHNPEASEDNVAVVVRDSQPRRVDCEPDDDLPDGHPGITIIEDPRAGAVSTAEARTENLAGGMSHSFRTARLTLERLILSPGTPFQPGDLATGETAVAVLRGEASICDQDASATLEGASGAWWYVEPGTRWSLATLDPQEPAEALLVHCAPPSN